MRLIRMHYIYPNEKDKERGGYYVNDDGKKVEWEEVYQWLMAENEQKTDQDDTCGTMTIFANPGNGNISSYMLGSSRFGHSWLKLTLLNNDIMTFGTFDKGVA